MASSSSQAFKPRFPDGPLYHDTPGSGVELAAGGGYKYVDNEESQVNRKVAWDFVKSVGNSLLEGKDLVRVSLPVRLFEPRSYIERITDAWCYGPNLLALAATEQDPVERMKYVVAFALGGLHLMCAPPKKPFNPILGETFQGVYADGTEVFCEQVSHHPPITSWQMMGRDQLYMFWGYGHWTASFRGNAIKANQKGPNRVRFNDGTEVTYEMPHMMMRGLLWGDRTFEHLGTMKFCDETNGVYASVTFHPQGGFVKNLFKWGGSKERSDVVRGEVFRVGMEADARESKVVMSTLEGSWVSHLDFDGRRYWEARSDKAMHPRPVEEPLPSDCRFREDLRHLTNGDFDRAQEYKVVLEEKQRYERRLRKEYHAQE